MSEGYAKRLGDVLTIQSVPYHPNQKTFPVTLIVFCINVDELKTIMRDNAFPTVDRHT